MNANKYEIKLLFLFLIPVLTLFCAKNAYSIEQDSESIGESLHTTASLPSTGIITSVPSEDSPTISTHIDRAAVSLWKQRVSEALGEALYHEGDYPAALVYFKNTESYSKNSVFYYMLADTYIKLGFLEESTHAIDEALKHQPNDVRFFILCGRIYLDGNLYSEAESCLAQAIKRDENHVEGLTLYARALMAQGKHCESAKALEHLHNTGIASHEVIQRLAKSHESCGNIQKAELYYLENTKTHKNARMSFLSLLQFYQRTVQVEKAAEIDNKLRKLEVEINGQRNLRPLLPSSR